MSDTEQGLAGESNASPEEIAAYYDAWASSGSYDDDVASWGYEAPDRVAKMVVAHLGGAAGRVLDAGCGTGAVGAALCARGVDNIIGGDFTPASVDAASERGVYRSVDHLDLNARLDFDDNRFVVVVSVGVFSYVADTAATIAEMLRITAPAGAVIFTQRTDLWAERDCDEILNGLVASGACTATTSEPSPYLPGHAEFGSDIGIIYTMLTKRA